MLCFHIECPHEIFRMINIQFITNGQKRYQCLIRGVTLVDTYNSLNCSSIFLLSLTGAIFTAQPQHTCGLSNPLSHEPLKAFLRGIQLLRTAVSHRIVDCQNPGSVLKAISQRNKIPTIYIKRIVFSYLPSLY